MLLESEIHPRSIDVSPTGRCPLPCNICWGPKHDTPERLITEEWLALITMFAIMGTPEIATSGGEPLLRKDLVKILKHSKEMGMRTTLSTNTLLLTPERAKELLPYVDQIGIPLDGSSPDMNALTRINKHHFDAVMKAMPLVREVSPKTVIKIRTVASKVNASDILSIGELLMRNRQLWDIWKIYQFTPVSYGLINRNKYELTDEEFSQISQDVRRTYPEAKNIDIYSSRDRNGKYVFINPDGSVSGVGNDAGYCSLGSWLDDDRDKLMDNIKKYITDAGAQQETQYVLARR